MKLLTIKDSPNFLLSIYVDLGCVDPVLPTLSSVHFFSFPEYISVVLKYINLEFFFKLFFKSIIVLEFNLYVELLYFKNFEGCPYPEQKKQ